MKINPNKADNVSACSARLTAAMLRRAVAVPILAAPPIRAIQAWQLLKVKVVREKLGLKCDAELVYKERNYWLGLKRPSLAGFKRPMTLRKRILYSVIGIPLHKQSNSYWDTHKRRIPDYRLCRSAIFPQEKFSHNDLPLIDNLNIYHYSSHNLKISEHGY